MAGGIWFGHPLDSTGNITFSPEVAQEMRQLQPVIWSKGTFLSPQHLQAQERFVEDSAQVLPRLAERPVMGIS